MKNREPWNFCETPKEKCTMNYCDDNGCQNRKRNYVEGNDLIADVSSSISVEDTVNAFLDWMKSDDCWINDKKGNRIPDAEIDGKNFIKYAEKYYR